MFGEIPFGEVRDPRACRARRRSPAGQARAPLREQSRASRAPRLSTPALPIVIRRCARAGRVLQHVALDAARLTRSRSRKASSHKSDRPRRHDRLDRGEGQLHIGAELRSRATECAGGGSAARCFSICRLRRGAPIPAGPSLVAQRPRLQVRICPQDLGLLPEFGDGRGGTQRLSWTSPAASSLARLRCCRCALVALCLDTPTLRHLNRPGGPA